MSFPAWLPFLLGLLTAVGPLATDMYLPAFDAIEHGFATPHGTAQITLSAWFAGLCIGQMTQGTLSDRFGRRRPLIAGTLLFALACAGCAMANSISSLAAWRMVSAFGGAALVGAFSDGTARPMAALMLAGAIASNIAEYCRPRRG